MTKELKAIFVDKTTHRRIKEFAVLNGVTMQELVAKWADELTINYKK